PATTRHRIVGRVVHESVCGLAQKKLHHEHISPLAVDGAVSLVHADLAKAMSRCEPATLFVLDEQLADDLVETGALGTVPKSRGNDGAETAAARRGSHVDTCLADSRVTGTGAVRGEPRPADHHAVALCHQHRVV